ncbi:Retrotransposon gag protein [Rhizoctonia solani]|uniref:Retrotransposon gag protein n=1 Tax=Rhizoctonia solani TaxID=456999 RepID=A0A8H7M6U9_9AGAM|nr:Retrotransposon gag protein [Rhizoctonia solani]
MEPEPTLSALLKAITALTTQVGSLQDQVKSQGEQITQLIAICKETNNLVGDKDQGGAQTKPGPLTGPVTPLPTQEGKPTLQAQLGLDSRPCSGPLEARALTRRMKKNQGSPKRSLKERLNGTSGPLPLRCRVQRQRKPPTTIQALTGKFKEAFANPDAKRAAARKIAALTQTTTTSEYVTEFRNLMAELDWNTEAYIAQFTRGLHWKVKELLSTKDNIPNDDLEAIFAALVKIDNTCRENKENRPKKTPTKVPVATTTSTSTTTTRVRLSRTPTMSPRRKGTVAAHLAFVSNAAKKGMGSNNVPLDGKPPSGKPPRWEK